MVCGVSLKTEETGQVQNKRRSGRPKKLSTADVQYLKVTFLRNREKKSTWHRT